MPAFLQEISPRLTPGGCVLQGVTPPWEPQRPRQQPWQRRPSSRQQPSACLLYTLDVYKRQLQIHKRVAESMGMAPTSIVVADNGSVIELTTKHIKCETTVPAEIGRAHV